MALAAIRLAFLAAGVALAIAAPAAAQERAPVDRKTMEAWARVLDTDDPARVVEAVENFNAAGPEAIPVLIGVVQKGTDLGATHACGLLASKGDEALVAVPAIEEAITRRDERYLRHAARALWKMGVRPEKSLASLRALAKTGDAAGTALVWRITGQEGNLRPILEHDARSPHLWQRAIAVDVLVAFGPTAGKEFSFPLALLLARDAKEWVRGRALRVLTAVDPRARESIAEYEFACRDSDRAVRFEALRGLVAAGFSTPGVLPALARSGQFLGNPLVPYQESALLSGSLENREEVVAALAPLLANEDLATRLGAALISNCLGSKTSDVARVLADGLGTDEFRPACLSALTALGEPAAAVVRDIAALLTDADQ
ncbi:MAG TPA: hypothetical protein VFS92_09755, partial [Planctomycetota bacterium]|nr:hypothetical protein [Planctomycetota bacterium]